MDQLTNLQIKKSDFESSQNDYKKASEDFERIQIEVMDSNIAVAEKMAFYAAGIISLSITFVGSLIERNKIILTSPFLHLPLISWLFVSWCLLLVALILGLMVKWLNNKYYYFVASSEWIDKQQKREKKMIDLLQAGHPWVFREGQTKESLLADSQKTIDANQATLEDLDKKENIYLEMKIWFIRLVFVSFILGVIFLAVFAMRSTYVFIW